MTLETTRNELADFSSKIAQGAEGIERPEPEDFEHIYRSRDGRSLYGNIYLS